MFKRLKRNIKRPDELIIKSIYDIEECKHTYDEIIAMFDKNIEKLEEWILHPEILITKVADLTEAKNVWIAEHTTLQYKGPKIPDVVADTRSPYE